MICVVVLDFDGVIAESLAVKTEAFRRLFSFAPDHLPEIIDYHRANGGMSRFDKFRYIYRTILKEPLSQERFDELLNTYADLVVDGVIASPLVEGARAFLERYSARMPLYISSGTPEPEIHHILRQRGLERYFKGVYGAPRTKSEALRDVLERERADPSVTIFVGDAVNDWKAAMDTGIRFIGRRVPGDPDRFEGLPRIEAVVRDLGELSVLVGREGCSRTPAGPPAPVA